MDIRATQVRELFKSRYPGSEETVEDVWSKRMGNDPDYYPNVGVGQD